MFKTVCHLITLSLQSISRVSTIDITSLDVDLDHQAEVVFVRLIYCKINFPSFPYCAL